MDVSCFEIFEIRSKLSSWQRFENFPILGIIGLGTFTILVCLYYLHFKINNFQAAQAPPG
jgi:hypothetical protein